MKLYYSPGACSIGIHVLLEEIGEPYERVLVSLKDGAQRGPEFLAVNPKGKVPVLDHGGGTLTEFPAIALWLALTNPEKRLLPSDADGQARAFETIDHLVATVHMQGFARMFRPYNFTPNEADQDAVKAKGREIFAAGLDHAAERLGDRDFAVGEGFTIADAALFYITFWAERRTDVPLPAPLDAYYARMTARPAVKTVMEVEGFA